MSRGLAAGVSAVVATTLPDTSRQGESRLRALYEKGKAAQWNAATDIDWSPAVEFGAPLPPTTGEGGFPFTTSSGPLRGTIWNEFRWEFQAWMVSQFLHGEQGALVATARLVETVPHIDARYYAANQVGDEARHVEAYSRYLDEKLMVSYPIDPALDCLLGDIMSEPRWDIVYLGMQIVVEGLAVAAFRVANETFSDPVILQITDLVARDEARHVSFGMLALEGFYTDLDEHELRDREEFLKEATLLMGRRFLLTDIWERLGVDVAAGVEFATTDPLMIGFRQVLFRKVLSSITRLGLLTPSLRSHLQELSLLRR